MKIEIVSLFPEMFSSLTEHGVVGRAISKGRVSLSVINPRQFTNDQRATVDDRPYGGGPGMVMMVEPLAKAIAAARVKLPKAKVVYLSPQGKKFDHDAAASLAARDSLILLAGRYEGVDERLLDSDVDEQYSIGDFVLSGGELPAMVMIDAMVRLLPESLGNEQSAAQDSFVDGLLDCPHYTRPEVYQGRAVPKVLLSGDHKAISRWREQQSLGRTWLFRPDLLEKIELDERQQALLTEFKNQL